MQKKHKDYLIDILPEGPWIYKGKKIEPSVITQNLSRWLYESHGKKAKSQVDRIKEWLNSWPKPLDNEIVIELFGGIYFIISNERMWAVLKRQSKEVKKFRSQANPNWHHYQDLQRALESAPSEAQKKRIEKNIELFLTDIGMKWLLAFEAWETAKHFDGQLNKTLMTKSSQIMTYELVKKLGEYCENVRDRSGKEERISNDKQAAKKLSELGECFGIEVPKNIRKLDVSKLGIKTRWL